MMRRLFRGRKNGANIILGDKSIEKGSSDPPPEFLEPVTMNESDVSSESAYSSLQETQTPVVQPALRRASGIHAEWEADKYTQKEIQSSPDKENPQVRPTKARSSLKGLMSRIKSR